MTGMYPRTVAMPWIGPRTFPTARVPSRNDFGSAAQDVGRLVFGFLLNLLALTVQLIGYLAFVAALLFAPFLLLVAGFPVMLVFGLVIVFAGAVIMFVSMA